MHPQSTSICPVCQREFNHDRCIRRIYCSHICSNIVSTKRRTNTAETFWSRVDKNGPNGCWIWKGGIGPTGYGYFYWQGKSVLAHRQAYEFLFGSIPEGLDCLHKCDNRPCVNAEQHIFLGTDLDNTRDRISKGRPCGCGPGDNNPNAKLSFAKASEIRAFNETGSYSYPYLAKKYSLGISTIGRVIKNQTWVA